MDLVARINASLAGHYALDQEIGRGGMATVFRARDLRHGRDVAVKLLRPEIGELLGADRFLAEIRLTAALQHPNILPLFDSGTADGLLYYVMPFVRGESLRDRLARDGALQIDEAVAIVRGIAGALDHAHRQGVVHRDVKPENVLMSDGVPMVADFGIARALTMAGDTRVTSAGMAIGTPAYMSPEQAAGEADVDNRSDLYSLGCVLFEMVTGRAPFTGPTAAAVITQHLAAPVPSARDVRTTIPPAVDAAISKAMSKDRTARFANAAELAAALSASPPVEPLPDYSKVVEPVTRTTTPLVGRSREYADLLARLDALPTGRGSFVLIGGEPGVGKTKLTEALLLEARARGHFCSVGHCYEMEGGPPYLPFLEQLEYSSRNAPPGRFRAALGIGAAEIARIMPGLRRMFPDIPEPLDLPPDQQRHYLFTQFREYLQRGCTHVPVVLLFDDLHWADDSTLLLLESLAPHVANQKVLVLGTYRDVELDVNRPFAKSLERLTRQRLADRITLRRMPKDDVAAMLSQIGAPDPPGALVDAVFAETEGNAFFVEEVFHHLREEGRVMDAQGRWLVNLRIDALEVPEGVRLVIGRRLERVSSECRSLLTAAAVIGPRFDLVVLEEVAGINGDSMLDRLDEAERAGLVIAQQAKRETRYTFAHELIRQTLLSALSVPRRIRRHQQTAEAIENVYAGRVESHASELAYHYFQSATEDKARHYLAMAGQQALAAGAFDEALSQVDRALSLGEIVDDRVHADLLWVKASALRALARWVDAKRAYLLALDRLEALGAQEDMVRLACMLLEMLYYSPIHDEQVALVERVLRVTNDVPSVDRAHLLAIGATDLGFTGKFSEGLALSDRALAMATALGDREAMAHVLSERAGLLQNYGRIEESVQCATDAIAAIADSGKRWALLWARTRLLHGYRFYGRNRDVVSMGEGLLREAAETGHLGAKLTIFTGVFSARWMTEPHIDHLASAAPRFLSDFGGLPGWSELAKLWHALDAFERDYPDPAELLSGSADRFEFEPWRQIIWGFEFFLRAHTHPENALTVLDQYGASLPVAGRPAFIGSYSAVRWVVVGLVRLGLFERAASWYWAAEEAESFGYRGDFGGVTQTVAGIAAACGKRWELAERHFDKALRFCIESPHVPEHPDVLYWRAWMLIQRGAPGDNARARESLLEAITLFAGLSRTRRVRESRELLATL